ncbi:MAG: ATPase, T2SS/T4P/T4SS family [Elusimicrobiota bacterium]
MSEAAGKIRDLLEMMEQRSASDLHLTVGMQPFIRINGEIIPTGMPIVSQEECESMLFSLISEEQKKKFYTEKVLDCSYGEKEIGRFRINIYRQRGTITAAIRRLPAKVPGIVELGLPEGVVKKLCNRSSGLIIIAGPVGCGKTTTMAAMAHYIGSKRNCHIISVEDPDRIYNTEYKKYSSPERASY